MQSLITWILENNVSHSGPLVIRNAFHAVNQTFYYIITIIIIVIIIIINNVTININIVVVVVVVSLSK